MHWAASGHRGGGGWRVLGGTYTRLVDGEAQGLLASHTRVRWVARGCRCSCRGLGVEGACARGCVLDSVGCLLPQARRRDRTGCPLYLASTRSHCRRYFGMTLLRTEFPKSLSRESFAHCSLSKRFLPHRTSCFPAAAPCFPPLSCPPAVLRSSPLPIRSPPLSSSPPASP